jgi:tetratricopeptide (TPR) repeat protein
MGKGFMDPRAIKEKFGDDYEQTYEDTLMFTLSPTFPEGNPEGLRVQDLMVLRILQASRWERPIYFAVTVSHENQLNMDKYLQMDGLAYKIVPYPVQRIDEPVLRENLLTKYQYRNLDNPDVFYNTGTIKLLINVRQAYLQLVRFYLNNGRQDDAAFILEEMSKRVPEENIPYAHERIAISVAEHYRRAGLPADHEKRIENVIPGRLMTRQDHLELAAYYTQIIKNYDKAEEIYQRLINENRSDVHAYSGLIQTYRQAKRYNEAVALLEDWLMRHPGDPNAQKELDELRVLAATADSTMGIPLE